MLVVRMPGGAQDLLRVGGIGGVHDDVAWPGRVPRGPQACSANAPVVTGDALPVKQLRHHLGLWLIVGNRHRDSIGRRGSRNQPPDDSPQRTHHASKAEWSNGVR